MASRAEQIADAIRVVLTVPTLTAVPAARVFRDLRGALQSELLPAIAIETGNDPIPRRVNVTHLMRTVEIRVTVLAAGANGYAAADPGHVESFNRIAADVTLGGLAVDIQEGAIVRDRDDAERQRIAVTHTYRVDYMTTDRSIE